MARGCLRTPLREDCGKLVSGFLWTLPHSMPFPFVDVCVSFARGQVSPESMSPSSELLKLMRVCGGGVGKGEFQKFIDDVLIEGS